MAHIYLKGVNEPLVLPYSKAEPISDRWTGNVRKAIPKAKGTETFEVDGDKIEYGMIRRVNLRAAGPEKRASNDEVERNYTEERNRRVSLSARVKSQNTGIFESLFWVYTGIQEVPGWILKAAIAAQEDFFIKNPRRTLSDPSIFKQGLEMLVRRGGNAQWEEQSHHNQMQSLMGRSAMRVIESNVATDMKYSR